MSILQNRTDILDRIRRISDEAQRPADAVRLMAVSKTQPDAAIDEVLAAGQRLFGENRVQEAQKRWGRNPADGRRAQYPDLQLHMIGPLQTNKAREAVALFDAIQTVDRSRLVTALAAEMQRQARWLPCFIQVNTGAEPQKAGVALTDFSALLDQARTAGLTITGVMAIPPLEEDPAPHFDSLFALAHTHGLPEISMGMSHDYDTAIRSGATIVRVGTALFGARATASE